MPELSYGSLPVPATPIGDMARWLLDIKCSHCRRHVPLHIKDLIQPYGEKIRIAEAVRRLRCSGLLENGKLCRAKPSQVLLLKFDGRRKVHEITVIGHPW
jgi:hypothetical protein